MCDLQGQRKGAEEAVTTATSLALEASVVYHYVADAYLIQPALQCLTPQEQTGHGVTLYVHTKKSSFKDEA